jgi:malonyl-CoA O-methyltransferase
MLAPPPLDPRALRLQFDRRANRFEEADFMLREVERRVLERMDYIRLDPKDVLDVGCGLGAGAAALAARWPQAAVTAVDQSPAMAQRARARLAGDAHAVGRALAGVRRLFGATAAPADAARAVRVAAADAHALPFPDASFDLVWSSLAMHWFVDPLAAVSEWRRVLRPGGC